jgi:hypothetical protein
VEATDGLGEVLTSEAMKTNSEWPFMTLSRACSNSRPGPIQGPGVIPEDSGHLTKWIQYD